MSNPKTRGTAVALALMLGAAHGQVPAHTGGTSLLPNDLPTAFSLFGQAEKGKLETVPVEGQPFKWAYRCATIQTPAEQWQLQLGTWIQKPVRQGDVLLVRFYVRSIKGQAETGEARTSTGFATGGPQWAKSMTQSINIPKDWKLIEIPFSARYDTEANGSLLAFDLGFTPQVFEIGGIELLNFRNTKTVGDLPRTRTDYPGQEAHAAWRTAALARIEKIRKGELLVKVVDSAGNPVPRIKVELKMQRHAFQFGSAVDAATLLGTGPVSDKYRQVVLDNFTAAPIENHLKWPFWETWGRADADRAVDWLRSNEISVPISGPLVWGGWTNLPEDLKSKAGDKAYLDERIKANIHKEMGAYRGKISEWEVVNEPYAQRDLWTIFGYDKMADYFREARKVDPTARLLINDYPPLDGAASTDDHLSRYYSYIESLVKAKAPIGGIGFQCHFGSSVIPPERILSGLDRFAKFGLPIAITEFDMDTTDEDLQGRYMRDFMTAAFSHPAVDEILMWGFWEGKHWMPNAALYRWDWSLKPNGQAWLDLVKRDWWTHVRGITDAKGSIANRSFYGVYEITVSTDSGKKNTVYYNFTKSGSPLNITLDGLPATPPKWMSTRLKSEATLRARLAAGLPLLGTTDFNLLADASHCTSEKATVEGQPFASDVRFDVLKATPNPWEVQALIVTNEAIHKGDRLRMTFFIRSTDSRPGKVTANFQGGPDYTVMDGLTLAPATTWTKVERSFTAPYDRAPGAEMFVLQMGYQVQGLEIGGLSIVNFGPPAEGA